MKHGHVAKMIKILVVVFKVRVIRSAYHDHFERFV